MTSDYFSVIFAQLQVIYLAKWRKYWFLTPLLLNNGATNVEGTSNTTSYLLVYTPCQALCQALAGDLKRAGRVKENRIAGDAVGKQSHSSP